MGLPVPEVLNHFGTDAEVVMKRQRRWLGAALQPVGSYGTKHCEEVG